MAAWNLLPSAASYAPLSESAVALAKALRPLKRLDALHVSVSETANATLLFTTDSGILNFGQTNADRLNVKIVDPALWNEVL